MHPRPASETLDARYAAGLQRAVSQQLPIQELIGCVDDLRHLGREDLGRELYRVWIEHNPADPALAIAQFNYGSLLLAAGAPREAENAFRATIALRPDLLAAQLNLGSAIEAAGDPAGAVVAWLAVVQRLDTINGETLQHKSMALKQIGRVCEQVQDFRQAEIALRQSLDLNAAQPDVAEHWIVLRQMQCKWPVLEPWSSMPRRAQVEAMSPLLLARHADTPMFQLALSYRCYCRDMTQLGAPYTVCNWPIPEASRPARLRIGYVCSDMRAHALGSLIVGLFALHDRERFEIFAYYTGPDVQDAIRTRIETTVDHWRDIAKLTPRPAAAQIVRDRIDILIDLNGHTDGGRAGIFALRPAPLIVNWLGYPGTMGTAHHQYIIADATIIPPHLEKYYSETVRRVPCYQPNDCARRVSATTPTRREFGLPDDAAVYCCFNGTAKFTSATFARWMQILQQVPHGVLWLLSGGDAIDARLQQSAAGAGIAPERVIFAARLPPSEHLVRYRVADLFLDTSPYGAHTTASDALWMGLPVLTWLGRSFAARVCGSLVCAAGLPALACESAAAYVQTAIRLGHDRAALQQYRQILRDHHATCALFDTRGLVASLEARFDEMWEDHASGRVPVPDLKNLALYDEIGRDEPHEQIEDLNLESYEQYYRNAMTYRDALLPIPPDHRLWQPGTFCVTQE